MRGLTTKVFEFRNQAIKPYIGDIYDYLTARKIETLDELNLKKTVEPDLPIAKPVSKAAEPVPVINREEQRRLENKRKKIEKSIKESEDKISGLEKQISTLETELSIPANFNRQAEMLNEYQKLEAGLKKEMEAWEALQLELEETGKG